MIDISVHYGISRVPGGALVRVRCPAAGPQISSSWFHIQFTYNLYPLRIRMKFRPAEERIQLFLVRRSLQRCCRIAAATSTPQSASWASCSCRPSAPLQRAPPRLRPASSRRPPALAPPPPPRTQVTLPVPPHEIVAGDTSCHQAPHAR